MTDTEIGEALRKLVTGLIEEKSPNVIQSVIQGMKHDTEQRVKDEFDAHFETRLDELFDDKFDERFDDKIREVEVDVDASLRP